MCWCLVGGGDDEGFVRPNIQGDISEERGANHIAVTAGGERVTA